MVAVNANGIESTTATVQVTLVPADDIATLTSNVSLTVVEDGTPTPLDMNQFNYTDEDGDALDHYEITSPINTPGFSLQNGTTTLTVGDTFTQADLLAGTVQIVSDGTNLAAQTLDPFTVVAVNVNGVESTAATVQVTLVPADDLSLIHI